MGFILKTYKSEIIRSMKFYSQDKKTLFLGQSVKYPGNAIYGTLTSVPDKKKIELPVFEDVQMGISIGLGLEGYKVISCYPRFDFLLLAFNQLINHLDKIQRMSEYFKPKVRTVSSKTSLYTGFY